MTKAEKATAKAEALLKAGDALGALFPAESKRLLRLCLVYRAKAAEAKKEAAK